MSILYRHAVPRSSPYAIAHFSSGSLFVTTSTRQPGLLSCNAVAQRPGSPFAYCVLGRRRFASRKLSKPSKRAEKLTKPSKRTEALTELSRDHHDRIEPSPKEIPPDWVKIVLLYAAFTAITWSCTTLFWLTHREKAPVTGRRRFAYFSAPQVSTELLSKEAQEVFQEIEKIQSLIGPLSERVRQVFMNIAAAAGVDDRQWKVYIIPDAESNAAVLDELSMVIIHSGIFKHFKVDDDLAVVLAHELAHVIANHEGEKCSRKVLELLYGIPYAPAGIVGALSIFAATAPETFVGALLVIPFVVGNLMHFSASRNQEREADIIGLLLMTEAGYSPYAARRFHASMKAEEDQEFATAEARARQISPAFGPPVIVAKVPGHKRTHPLTESRIEDLSRLAPQALAIVKGEVLDLQRARTPVDKKLLRGWKDFKASRGGERGRRPETRV